MVSSGWRSPRPNKRGVQDQETAIWRERRRTLSTEPARPVPRSGEHGQPILLGRSEATPARHTQGLPKDTGRQTRLPSPQVSLNRRDTQTTARRLNRQFHEPEKKRRISHADRKCEEREDNSASEVKPTGFKIAENDRMDQVYRIRIYADNSDRRPVKGIGRSKNLGRIPHNRTRASMPCSGSNSGPWSGKTDLDRES